MRLYSREQEENLYIRRKASTWERSGLITNAQRVRLEWETDPEAYALAEYIVKKHSLYRYGIEEALALNAVVLVAIGSAFKWQLLYLDSSSQVIAICLTVCAGALWLYVRFGFLYTAFIAIMSLSVIPFFLHMPPSSERMLLFMLLTSCLAVNNAADKRSTADFQKENNAFIQAGLILGMYFAANLRINHYIGQWEHPAAGQPYFGFPTAFFWTTYVCILIMPVLVLLYGIIRRKRACIDAGLLIALATIVVNKDYLGIKHYAWDPAVLGILLIGATLIVIRLLKHSKSGLTSERILKPEEYGIDLAAVTAFAAPSVGAPGPTDPFSGGQSGGGGASRNF